MRILIVSLKRRGPAQSEVGNERAMRIIVAAPALYRRQ